MPEVRARTRAVVTAAAAVVALVSTGSLVSAHGGDSNAVHACIVPSSGYLRVVDASADCKKGETPIDWSLGSGLAAGSVTGQGNNLVASQPGGALALETVGRANIVAGAIDTAQLADNAVTASKLASALLADLVTEAELEAELGAAVGPGTITGEGDNVQRVNPVGELALGTVGGANLVDGAVGTAALADNAVTATKLAAALLADLVTEQELTAALGPGTIAGEGDNTARVTPTAGLKIGTVGRANLVDDAVDATKLADGAVDATKLAAALLADLVTESELAALLPIDAADLAVGAVNGAAIAANAVGGNHIVDGTITAADLAGHDSAGPWDTEVAGAVTSEKVRDGTIEARDIANGAVTALKLAAGAVTGGHVANGSLSPDDTTANAASSTAAGPTEVAVGGSEWFGQLELTVAGGVHAVHVTGQGVVECTACTDAADSVTVQWTLVDGTTAVVAQTPAVTLTSTDRMATLPISFLVPDAAAGAHTYSVAVSVLAGGSDPVVASSFGLVAVDLGRAPGP